MKLKEPACDFWQNERMEQPHLDEPGAGLPFLEALKGL